MLTQSLIDKYTRPLFPIKTGLKVAGRLKQKIQSVLFDVYGTLFISGSGDIGHLEQESPGPTGLGALLCNYGFKETPRMIRNTLASTIKRQHQIKKAMGIEHPEIEIDKIWMEILGIDEVATAKKFGLEWELLTNPVYPMPNVKKVLSLCKRRNIAMGLISNAQFYTSYMFEWLLGAPLSELGFDDELIILSYRIGHAKTSALLFQKAREELRAKGISEGAVLYVGNDMLNDIYPAKAIGFQTALFAGDKRSLRLREGHPQCKGLGADLILTDLVQLIDYI